MLKDGRKTTAEIAKETGLTKEIISENYNAMEKEGIIKGATIHINYRGFGYKAVAILLINVDPTKADQLVKFIEKMEDIYSVYRSGPKGNIRVITTLKTLQQLDGVKDAIKKLVPILNMRTVIWTDVRETHENLTVTQQEETDEHGQKISRTGPPKIIAIQKEKIEIDEIDSKIVEALSNNGLVPFTNIAQGIKISTNAVKKRYERLKKNGLLKVTIQIDPAKLGYRAIAIFYLTFTLRRDASLTIDKISQIPDIISIMKTAGDYDLQVYAMIKDIDQLLTIQNELAKMVGVAEIEMDLSKVLFDKWPTPRQYISTF